MESSQPPFPQLPSLSELESRMQVMRVSALEENQTGETFSQRPLLLSLCQDLFDGYVTLLDRFNHSKPQNSKPTSHDNDSDTDISSEVSFQQTQVTTSQHSDIDELVSKLVTANLENDIAQHELHRREHKFQQASKTIELLKKLVMLLDMEKEVAVEETANLGYKLASLLEENRELAIEARFMKNEALRLARCVLKMREEHFHKVCLLEHQIYSMQSSRESGYESRLNTINPFTKCNLSQSSAPLHRATL
ncbi:unnamed protein product [Arabis nemorensis]|uniref:NAB domain-containing protein n=1 Tax=Arabis nemorensis TaxID=586526 RepID=A0A565BGZ5_9BRAS|nr:unnamed protein product [Arabis nemorensis]